jgi:AGCS family alanine or glycine:cation symporter
MWISAFLGMMTAYAETSLGIRFRGRLCGPFSYMERGLGLKPMASAYSFLCLLCALGMGSMVQANSAVETLHYTWKLPVFFCGLVFTGLLALVVCGGSRRIGAVAQALIPLASGLYLLFSLLVIISNHEQLPRAVAAIFSSAFCLRPAAGGIAGYGMIKSMRYGIARGVFSNEAGLGTLAILHGSAGETTPEEQGMWAMFEVFFDTVVLCTLTALVILSSVGGEAGRILLNGAPLAAWCFEKCLGRAGGWVVSASMTLFAFATIIAWFYVGKQAASYLVGENHFFAGKIYPFLFLGAVFLGCSGRLEAVWLFSDIVNGLMAFPNLTALLFLANEVRVPKTKENVSPSDDTFL